jgi:hypothetical protein
LFQVQCVGVNQARQNWTGQNHGAHRERDIRKSIVFELLLMPLFSIMEDWKNSLAALYFGSPELLETAGLISEAADVGIFGLLGCSVSGFTGISTGLDGVMALTSKPQERNLRARFSSCNWLIVNALHRCAGDEFMEAEPLPPRFTHSAPTHPVFPYFFNRKSTAAPPLSVSDATGFVFLPSVFLSIKSPTLELKACICALLSSI